MKKRLLIGLLLFNISVFSENPKIDIPIGYFTSVDENSVMEVYCRKAWADNKLLDDSINCSYYS
jgi:hypothetical protein